MHGAAGDVCDVLLAVPAQDLFQAVIGIRANSGARDHGGCLRRQSHGAYKLIFNAIYDSPAVSRPTAVRKSPEPAVPRLESWKPLTGRVHSDLAALLRQNQVFFAARGSKAVEERGKLWAGVEQFEKERIAEVQDAAAALDEPARRKAGEYIRQLRRVAADLRSKEFEPFLDADALAERYQLPAIEQQISASES